MADESKAVYRLVDKVPEEGQTVWFHLKKGGKEMQGKFVRPSAVHLNGAHFLVTAKKGTVRFYMNEVDTWHEN